MINLNRIKTLINLLFGKCEVCGRWFQYPKRRRMSTMYHNEEDNYCTTCSECYDCIEEIWNERWREYYSSR